MSEEERAKLITQKMYDGDAFSQWLGISIKKVEPGYCLVQMTVRAEMTNGFNITHGGITYSLADSALAFASNGHGNLCVSIETSISHQEAVHAGDELTAEAEEIKRSNRIAWYHIRVTNQEHKLVASFNGTVYRTLKQWEL